MYAHWYVSDYIERVPKLQNFIGYIKESFNHDLQKAKKFTL